MPPYLKPQVTAPATFVEGWSYIPPDAVEDGEGTGKFGPGDEYRLDRLVGRYVTSVAGLGMAPIEYQTQQGPFQQGATALDYRLQPRVIQIGIRQTMNDRKSLWGHPMLYTGIAAPPFGMGREGLLNALRPNRISPTSSGEFVPGRLRFRRQATTISLTPAGRVQYRAGGTSEVRDIWVHLTQGLDAPMPRDGVWDQYAIQDVIRLIAHDPLFFNPKRKSITATAGDTGGWNITIDAPYLGNFADYPVVVFDEVGGGALNLASVILQTQRYGGAAETVNLLATTGTAAETAIVFDFRYGYKTVYSQPNLVNLVPYLDAASDLATFRLEPFPTAATGGVNQIEITATGVGVNTRITVYWYERFVGI